MTNIDTIPRVKINCLPTPLVELKRLSSVLGGPRIMIKRDDLTGPALGGNKTRKLEFLLGEALSQNCNAVIACGATQSNCCRQVAATAAAVGLECHLALSGEQPAAVDSNLLLDYLAGATVHWCGEYSKGELVPDIAAKLRAAGRKPYIIPFGASNEVGALGFVAAIGELKEQLAALNYPADYIITPSSSGGTHAGMTVGAEFYGLETQIIGIGIDLAASGEPPYEAELAALANRIANKLGTDPHYTAGSFHMNYAYHGEGYEVISDAIREAVRLTASLEGIILDPIYTGRTMAGLMGLIRNKTITARDTVVFWHTGGLPAIFRFAREII